jgi:hypothetical protein
MAKGKWQKAKSKVKGVFRRALARSTEHPAIGVKTQEMPSTLLFAFCHLPFAF